MKRTVKQVIIEAWQLFWQDIKNLRVVILAIAGYYTVAILFLHSSCMMVTMTGFPCPGCGLTRAGFSLLHLRFERAFELHPFIYPIALLLLIFFIMRYILKKDTKVLQKWVVLLIVGLIIFYVYRMIRYFPSQPPMSYYSRNVLKFIFTVVRNIGR